MNSEITLIEALSMLEPFSPVRITFNGVLLYDDYDYDETASVEEVLSERLWKAESYIVTDIKIKIVEFHHSIVELCGRYHNVNDN